MARLLSMPFSTIEYVTTFDLKAVHHARFRREAGMFFDTLKLFLDGVEAVHVKTNGLQGEQKRRLHIDGVSVELIWKWSPWTGGPVYIMLLADNKLLAKYGNYSHTTDAIDSRSEAIVPLRPIKDVYERTEESEIARENFPLDNTAGSSELTVLQEVTRSVTTSIRTEENSKVITNFGAKFIAILEASLGLELSKSLSIELGKLITKRQSLEFRVKPGDSIIYTVIWKKTTRIGKYVIELNKISYEIHYKADTGLSFEVASRRADQRTQAAESWLSVASSRS